jgi:hypothetical protein
MLFDDSNFLGKIKMTSIIIKINKTEKRILLVFLMKTIYTEKANKTISLF